MASVRLNTNSHVNSFQSRQQGCHPKFQSLKPAPHQTGDACSWVIPVFEHDKDTLIPKLTPLARGVQRNSFFERMSCRGFQINAYQTRTTARNNNIVHYTALVTYLYGIGRIIQHNQNCIPKKGEDACCRPTAGKGPSFLLDKNCTTTFWHDTC